MCSNGKNKNDNKITTTKMSIDGVRESYSMNGMQWMKDKDVQSHFVGHNGDNFPFYRNEQRNIHDKYLLGTFVAQMIIICT